MQKYYKIEDIEIKKWLKNPDGSYCVVISASDGFAEEVPPSSYEGITDSTTVDDLKAKLKPYVEGILTAEYSARNDARPTDMLA